MKDVTFNFPVVTREGFLHGLRCPKCGVDIRDGRPYASTLTDMTDGGEYITEITCVYCTDLIITIT